MNVVAVYKDPFVTTNVPPAIPDNKVAVSTGASFRYTEATEFTDSVNIIISENGNYYNSTGTWETLENAGVSTSIFAQNNNQLSRTVSKGFRTKPCLSDTNMGGWWEAVRFNVCDSESTVEIGQPWNSKPNDNLMANDPTYSTGTLSTLASKKFILSTEDVNHVFQSTFDNKLASFGNIYLKIYFTGPADFLNETVHNIEFTGIGAQIMREYVDPAVFQNAINYKRKHCLKAAT